LCIFMPRSGLKGLLGLWCGGLLRWGGPGSIILSGFGRVLNNGLIFALPAALFWWSFLWRWAFLDFLPV
jgi:hypothetical protein